MDLEKLIGKKVIAERKGILIPGVLTETRTQFGRLDGRVKLPKGSRPPKLWFRSDKIAAAKP